MQSVQTHIAIRRCSEWLSFQTVCISKCWLAVLMWVKHKHRHHCSLSSISSTSFYFNFNLYVFLFIFVELVARYELIKGASKISGIFCLILLCFDCQQLLVQHCFFFFNFTANYRLLSIDCEWISISLISSLYCWWLTLWSDVLLTTHPVVCFWCSSLQWKFVRLGLCLLSYLSAQARVSHLCDGVPFLS